MADWQVNKDGQAFPMTKLGPVDRAEDFKVIANEWVNTGYLNIEVTGAIMPLVFEAIRAANEFRTEYAELIKDLRTGNFAQSLGDTLSHADFSTRLS